MKMDKQKIITCMVWIESKMLIMFLAIMTLDTVAQNIPNQTFYTQNVGTPATINRKGIHPDSIVGKYYLFKPQTDIIAQLELRPDGSFVCISYFGSLIRTVGHWNILDGNRLNINSGKPQIEVEEMYLEGKKDVSIYFFEKVTEGYLRILKQFEIFLNINGEYKMWRSDSNGILTLKSNDALRSFCIKDTYNLSNIHYDIRHPKWSNVFIIKISLCLQFDNILWEIQPNGEWMSGSLQYKDFKLIKQTAQ